MVVLTHLVRNVAALCKRSRVADFYRDLVTVVGRNIGTGLVGDICADGFGHLDQLALVYIMTVFYRNLLASGNVLDPDLVRSRSLPVELTLLLVVLLALCLSVRLVGWFVGGVALLLVSSIALLLLSMEKLLLVLHTTFGHMLGQALLLVLHIAFLGEFRDILGVPYQLVLHMTLHTASITWCRASQSQA
jgi:hypothetical protein